MSLSPVPYFGRARTRSMLRTAAAALVVALMLAACGGDDRDAGDASGSADGGVEPVEEVTIRVSSVGHLIGGYPGYWVARGEGYFEEEGINIEQTPIDGGPAVIQALLTGSAEIGLVSFSTALQAGREGRPLVVVGGTHIASTSQIVVSTDFLEGNGVAPEAFADLTVEERVVALTGARWGVDSAGGLNDRKARFLADVGGIDPDSDLTIVPVGSGEAAGVQFGVGNIDIFSASSPDWSDLVESGEAVTLLDPDDPDEVPEIGYALGPQIIAEPGWAAEHADELERFLRAVQRGSDFLKEREPAEVAAVLHEEFPEIDLDELERGFVTDLPLLALDGRLPEATIEANIDFALATGAIIERPDLASVYTDAYLPPVG